MLALFLPAERPILAAGGHVMPSVRHIAGKCCKTARYGFILTVIVCRNCYVNVLYLVYTIFAIIILKHYECFDCSIADCTHTDSNFVIKCNCLFGYKRLHFKFGERIIKPGRFSSRQFVYPVM